MIALITDICARVTPLMLSSLDTESAIQEIILNHRNLLTQSGLTPEWIDRYAYEELELCDPQWEANIRIYTWWACYSQYESDDEIVTAFVADTSKAKTTHTGIFFSPCGEFVVFEYNEVSQEDLRLAIYGRIQEGLTDFVTDTQEAFSPAWVDRNHENMPMIENVMRGLRFCQWTGDCKYEEFNLLRLYLIENRLRTLAFSGARGPCAR
jgi:hypothetical protein